MSYTEGKIDGDSNRIQSCSKLYQMMRRNAE